MRRRFLLLVLLIVSMTCLNGQSKFDQELINRKNGLSDNYVTSIIQDKTGYLWIGTSSGLNRFDGHEFKVFRSEPLKKNSLTSNFISTLSIDHSNILWIGLLDRALNSYNLTTGEFKHYDSIPGLPVATINSIYVDEDNTLWLGYTKKGFCKFNPRTGEVHTYSLSKYIHKSYSKQDQENYNTVYNFYKDKRGCFWIGTQDGLYKFDPKHNQLDAIRLVPDGRGTYRDDWVNIRSIDESQEVIYMPCSSGLRAYNFLTKQISYPLKFDHSVKENIFMSLLGKSKHEIWLITSENGLGAYNIKTKKIDFSIANPLPTTYCNQIFSTTDHLWISSDRGIIKINLSPKSVEFHPVQVSPSRFSAVTDFYYDKNLNKTFIGTEYGRGLLVHDSVTHKTKQFDCKTNDQPWNIIGKIVNLDSSYLLVLSRDYIQLFDKKKERWADNIPNGNTTNNIRAYFSYALKDKSGIWIGSLNDGLRFLSDSTYQLQWYTKDSKGNNSLLSNKIRGITRDPWGRIWFATADSGVFIYDYQKKAFTNLNKLNAGVVLPFNNIETIAISKDSIAWIGSISNGLTTIKLKNKYSFSFAHYNQPSYQGPAIQIHVDQNNRVWGLGVQSAFVINSQRNALKYIDLFNMNPASIIETAENGIIISAPNGYFTVNEKSLFKKDPTLEPIVINSLKINGMDVNIPSPGGLNKFSLPYDKNSILIEFSSVDLCDSHLRQYSFKLEGWEDMWNYVTSSQKLANYPHLPGGDYIFKLRTTNEDGLNGVEKSLLKIHIETPFWKTTWFKTSGVFTFFLVVYFFLRYRLNHLLKEQSLKRELSEIQLVALRTQMNPHFIFNSLNAIQGLIIRSDVAKATQFTARFSKLIRKVLENSEQQLIPLSEEIETLELYLSTEAIRFEGKFKYHIHSDEGIKKIEIPSMVIQPIVENVIWEGLKQKTGIGEVTIEFMSINTNKLKCSITDNGREKNQHFLNQLSLPEKSIALKLTASRLSLLSNHSSINSEEIFEQGEKTGNRVVVIFDLKPFLIRSKEKKYLRKKMV